MKTRFLQAALFLSLSLGSYALADSLVINADLQEVPADIKGYDSVTVLKDCDVNSIENDTNTGTEVFAKANLNVDSDLNLRYLGANQYNGESKVTVNGDLNIAVNDTYSGVYNGKLELGSTAGNHELVVTGTTTVTGKANFWSNINKSGKLTTEKLVTYAGMTVGGTVYANEIEVNSKEPGVPAYYLSVTSTGKIKSKDGNGGTITVNSGANVQLQGAASSELDLVVQGGKVSVLENCTTASLSDVTMNGGELIIKGDIKTGALTLNEGALTFDFSYGKTPLLDLGGNDLVIGDDVSITLNVKNMEEVADEYVLFTNLGETSGLDSVEIELVSLEDNQTKTVRASYSNGAVVLIPEPTTATLSLLALAGLAARRRRASR